MFDLLLTDWDHSLFEELQQILPQVIARPTTSLIRRLYARLDQARPWLLGLTQLPGPSDQDRQNVEKGDFVSPVRKTPS